MTSFLRKYMVHMVQIRKFARKANIFDKVHGTCGTQAKNQPETATFLQKYTVHMVHKRKFARDGNIFVKVHGTHGTQTKICQRSQHF